MKKLYFLFLLSLGSCLFFLSVTIASADLYYPNQAHLGGWRKNTNPDFIKSLGLDPDAVEKFGEYNLSVRSDKPASAIVILLLQSWSV